RHAAVVPRSCRLKEVMSRFRKRHWRPFLKAGRMLLRASSLTVSGLQSRISATSLLFSKLSSASSIRAPWRSGTLFWYQGGAFPSRNGKFRCVLGRLSHFDARGRSEVDHLDIETIDALPAR